jgi:GMP synthase (glutamine-hydrolysing)
MTARSPTAVAIRHVHFEDLGSFGPVLEARGYAVRYVEAGREPVDSVAAREADLLVVLGAPIGAYEDAVYPFLREELGLLESRLREGRSVLGICLGAQLLARALGARVYPGPAREIGWAPLEYAAGVHESPLAPLAAAGGPVLHWHGDTFDLPAGTQRLASTAICVNQAFRRGDRALGLQFHPEVLPAAIESWLIGHAAELAHARIDPLRIRADTARFGPGLVTAATTMFSRWLDTLSGQC